MMRLEPNDLKISARQARLLAREAAQRANQARMLASAARRTASQAAWIVVRVLNGQEMSVEKCLSEAGVETFLPVREGRKTYRRGQPVAIPPRAMIPGYLFIRMDISAHAIQAILHVRGVIGMLGGAENPLKLSEQSISAFRLRLSAPKEEVVIDDAWVSPGVRCIVEGGPFASFSGSLVPFHRHASGHVKMRRGPNVMVCISLAGKETEVEMPLAFVRKI